MSVSGGKVATDRAFEYLIMGIFIVARCYLQLVCQPVDIHGSLPV